MTSGVNADFSLYSRGGKKPGTFVEGSLPPPRSGAIHVKLVPYYRVSTAKQARSGLGLEGQDATVQRFAEAHAATILKSYVEVETGKRSDRPELAKAVAHARRSKATLVIAKLDRLARNVHFLSGLMEAGVKFVACDQPSANELTIHILAAVAQDEAKRISERTKAALEAYKARGGKLGASRPECRNLTAESAQREPSPLVMRLAGMRMTPTPICTRSCRLFGTKGDHCDPSPSISTTKATRLAGEDSGITSRFGRC